MFRNNLKFIRLFAIFLLAAFWVAGCSIPATEAAPTEDAEHIEGEHDAAGEHEHGGRIPNDGAVIRIVSPVDGATFASGDDILVEIEIENFELNADGTHWHLYVDGVTYGMVVGDNTRQVLRGLEPGVHEISAYLGLGTHEELEDGGTITITVTE